MVDRGDKRPISVGTANHEIQKSIEKTCDLLWRDEVGRKTNSRPGEDTVGRALIEKDGQSRDDMVDSDRMRLTMGKDVVDCGRKRSTGKL